MTPRGPEPETRRRLPPGSPRPCGACAGAAASVGGASATCCDRRRAARAGGEGGAGSGPARRRRCRAACGATRRSNGLVPDPPAAALHAGPARPFLGLPGRPRGRGGCHRGTRGRERGLGPAAHPCCLPGAPQPCAGPGPVRKEPGAAARLCFRNPLEAPWTSRQPASSGEETFFKITL